MSLVQYDLKNNRGSVRIDQVFMELDSNISLLIRNLTPFSTRKLPLSHLGLIANNENQKQRRTNKRVLLVLH